MRKSSLEASRIRASFPGHWKTPMGPQHWWPAGSPFEVVVGAYLTQNTAWTNVERAMGNLREAGVLSIVRNSPHGTRRVGAVGSPGRVLPAEGGAVEGLCRASGCAAMEARWKQMFAQPTEALREELLGLAGIGPETADSILLYAANREVFVVDSYTRRIFERHGLAKVGAPYEEIRLAVQQAMTGAVPAAKPESRRGQGQGQPPRREASKAGTRSEDGPRAVASHRPSPASPWHAANFRSATTSSTRCWCRRRSTTA